MRSLRAAVVLTAVLAAGRSGQAQVISQVYGGGGSSTAFYNRDFVELYNPSTTTVNLSGLALRLGPANSTAGLTGGLYAFPSGASIAPGRFFLVAFQQSNATGTPLPATPDLAVPSSANFDLSAAAGQLALVVGTAPISPNEPNVNGTANLLDFVGYGNAVRYEGTAGPAPAGSVSRSLIRQPGPLAAGLPPADTNMNLSDFTFQEFTGNSSPVVRNSQFTPVPEPAAVLALTAGGLGLLRLRRRHTTGAGATTPAKCRRQ